MTLIIIFGPDGAGKTTLSKLLIARLRERGYDAVYLKMRVHHLFMYLILRLLQHVGVVPRSHSPRILDFALGRIFGKSAIYPLLETVNILIWYIIRVGLLLSLNKAIVADRFSPDTIVSLSIISNKLNKIIIKLLLLLCKDSYGIYIYATPDLILNRKKDEELSTLYIKYQLLLYKKILTDASVYMKNIIIINTSILTPQEAVESVLTKLLPNIQKYN
jgi:GTPase SAR1 family protein